MSCKSCELVFVWSYALISFSLHCYTQFCVCLIVNILFPKPAKSVRFLTDEDSPPPRLRTSSWSSGSQVPSNSRPGPPLLEVWAPSLTLGRDGPGIILKEGKAPILRKGLETAITDLNSNPQKPISSQPSLSAVSAQFSPSRYVVFVCLPLKTESSD